MTITTITFQIFFQIIVNNNRIFYISYKNNILYSYLYIFQILIYVIFHLKKYPPKLFRNVLSEGACPFIYKIKASGTEKQISISVSRKSSNTFKVWSILSFIFFSSGNNSYNLFPNRTFFLIGSGNSLVLLNLMSTSRDLKYFKKIKGGELAKSGSIVANISFSLFPMSLPKES